VHSRAAASVENKMATMQHKIFCVCEFIKTESATAVQRAFRLRFIIQPPTRKSICRWNYEFEQTGCLCIRGERETYEIEPIFLNHSVYKRRQNVLVINLLCYTLRCFGLPPLWKSDLCSSGMLHRVDW
jgi:hypothetical protein